MFARLASPNLLSLVVKKIQAWLHISRSFIHTFEINLEDTFTRCEKYSSKLDIYRSFIRIFDVV